MRMGVRNGMPGPFLRGGVVGSGPWGWGGYLQLLPGSSRERGLRVLRVATELRPAALGPLEAC